MNIKPLADKVIVKPDEVSKSQSTGGIIIPDTAKEKPQRGEVVAVGPGEDEDSPMHVKAGDKVLYSKYGGTELEYEGETYLIMSESEIYAIFE